MKQLDDTETIKSCCSYCDDTGYDKEKNAHVPIYGKNGMIDFVVEPLPCEHCSEKKVK